MTRAGMVTVSTVFLCMVALFTAHRAEALSLQSFVTVLLERGIISAEKEEVARTLVRFLGDTPEHEPGIAVEAGLNAKHVVVQASQLIEHSHRTYHEGENILGLLLNVHNIHSEPIELSGRARCHVSYRILNADNGTQLYNSAEHEPCTTHETSTYVLGAKDIRMFEIRHTYEKFPLSAGEYMFVMEYPGYGGGELEVVVK